MGYSVVALMGGVCGKRANQKPVDFVNKDPEKKNIAELKEEDPIVLSEDQEKPVDFLNKDPEKKKIVLSEDQAQLIRNLDLLNGKNIEGTVEKIFREFDLDGNGVLEGAEFKDCVQKFAEHVLREYQETVDALCKSKAERGESKKDIDEFRSEHDKDISTETFKDMVRLKIDQDGDGKITLEEAMIGFSQVVDLIDEKE